MQDAIMLQAIPSLHLPLRPVPVLNALSSHFIKGIDSLVFLGLSTVTIFQGNTSAGVLNRRGWQFCNYHFSVSETVQARIGLMAHMKAHK